MGCIQYIYISAVTDGGFDDGIYALYCIQYYTSVITDWGFDLGFGPIILHFSTIFHLSLIWVGFYSVLFTLQLIIISVLIIAYGFYFHVITVILYFLLHVFLIRLLWIFPEQISAQSAHYTHTGSIQAGRLFAAFCSLFYLSCR